MTQGIAGRALLIAGLTMAVAGCGGSSGGGTGSSGSIIQTPAPTPTSTEPPVSGPGVTPPTGSASFPLGLTQASDFPTLSWLFQTNANAEPNPSDRVEYGYRGGQDWDVRLPGGARSALTVYPTETGPDFNGAFFNSLGGHSLYMLTPGLLNPVMALESTSAGYWGWSSFNGATAGRTGGVLAYGVPTLAGDVPATGSARYSLFGFAAARPSGTSGISRILMFRGTVDVDFSARSFIGDFGARVPNYSLTALPGIFTFAQIDASADRTAFTGRLSPAQDPGDTMVEGRFAGPQARELMMRWRGKARNSATGQMETLYGVVVGRRS